MQDKEKELLEHNRITTKKNEEAQLLRDQKYILPGKLFGKNHPTILKDK